jgi:hypothetical protein
MLVIALPFIWCGVALTLRRLRSAGLPIYAVVLFFAPMPMNLIVFLVLSMLPPRPARGAIYGEIDESWRSPGYVKSSGVLAKTLPEGRWGGAIAAVLLPLPFALLLTAVSTRYLQYYGWGLFVGLPFVLPMISVVQHHLWPAAYWRLWSNAIIHRIHQRVLKHIKRSAERN